MFEPGEPRFTDRETAREYRKQEIARPDPIFSTYDPEWIRGFHKEALKWIDCAPEGANHILAPLQGKDGRPCNVWENNENIGPNRAMREARAVRGLNPFNGDQIVTQQPWEYVDTREEAVEAYRKHGHKSRVVWRPRKCDDGDPLD